MKKVIPNRFQAYPNFNQSIWKSSTYDIETDFSLFEVENKFPFVNFLISKNSFVVY